MKRLLDCTGIERRGRGRPLKSVETKPGHYHGHQAIEDMFLHRKTEELVAYPCSQSGTDEDKYGELASAGTAQLVAETIC